MEWQAKAFKDNRLCLVRHEIYQHYWMRALKKNLCQINIRFVMLTCISGILFGQLALPRFWELVYV